ncbi:MAG TPA: hypothetical protein VM513_01760 [Kofleriaceae bacterium]|jgi:hypothetical protein|nr:hypothetical protein [Kofleriaceae bacterium]
MRRSLLVLALLGACDRGRPATPTIAVLASAPHYKVELAACTAPCEPTLVFTGLAGYKVNADYPHRWIPDAASAEAAPGPGTFTQPAKTVGALRVPVRTGTTRVTGKVKLAVCTDEQCKIEEPAIAFDVPR